MYMTISLHNIKHNVYIGASYDIWIVCAFSSYVYNGSVIYLCFSRLYSTFGHLSVYIVYRVFDFVYG